MLYFRWLWIHSHLQVLAPNIDTVGGKHGGCLEEKVAFVDFCCWFHVWNCSDLGHVSKNMEKTSQKHQTTTKDHAINHQNLDVHDFIRLVISSSPFSKKLLAGTPKLLKGLGRRNFEVGSKGLDVTTRSDTFCWPFENNLQTPMATQTPPTFLSSTSSKSKIISPAWRH